MAHHFEYTVRVAVNRDSGKFASRDEIDEALREALDGAQNDASLSGLGADGDSEYSIEDWSVD